MIFPSYPSNNTPLTGYSKLERMGYSLCKSPTTPPGRPARVGPPRMGLFPLSRPTHFKKRLQPWSIICWTGNAPMNRGSPLRVHLIVNKRANVLKTCGYKNIEFKLTCPSNITNFVYRRFKKKS